MIDTLKKQSIDGNDVVSWTPWSDCSKTCGVGIRERHSLCGGGQPCGITMHESEECTVHENCCKSIFSKFLLL